MMLQMMHQSFYHDRLGTNIGKALKKRDAFSCSAWGAGDPLRAVLPGEKTALFAPFIYKMHYFTKTGSGRT
jgi:hypothetical protein